MKGLTDHPGCKRIKAAVIGGEYIKGCPQCLTTTTTSADYAAKYKRNAMRKDNQRDLVQRYDGEKVSKEWVQLHEQKARQALGDQAVEDILRT